MRRLAPKCPLLLAQTPREQHSLCVRQASPVFGIVPNRINVAGKPTHGYLRIVLLATVITGHGAIIADHEGRRARRSLVA
jgi:hypothetical protein